VTTVSQSDMAAPTPDFSGVEFATSADGLSVGRPAVLLHRPPKPGGWAMINIRASKRLAKAIAARREIQRPLECLTRQIAARRRTVDDG